MWWWCDGIRSPFQKKGQNGNAKLVSFCKFYTLKIPVGVDSARAQPFQDCTWHAYGHAHTTCRVGPLLFNRTMFFGWRQWTSSYPSYIDVRGPKLGNPKILWLIIICPMKVWMYTMINPCIPHFVGNPHVNHSRSTGRRPWRWPLCRNLWKARRKEMEHGA